MYSNPYLVDLYNSEYISNSASHQQLSAAGQEHRLSTSQLYVVYCVLGFSLVSFQIQVFNLCFDIELEYIQVVTSCNVPRTLKFQCNFISFLGDTGIFKNTVINPPL